MKSTRLFIKLQRTMNKKNKTLHNVSDKKMQIQEAQYNMFKLLQIGTYTN